MALTPGTRLGVYEVTAQIGEGGMGQVYRGTDTTLGRQVAIKILPDAFASDHERLARFEREAKTLASLNHPNIAAIYGFEKSGGTHALAMELVEGEDLSQRIGRSAIPLDEALPIAKQIAEALEAAHEQGIVHRDLKPANIKVRPDGTVKVLDFGLAKAMEPAADSSPSMSMSPTLTTPAMTQAGIILGTAAYMSPEQARGRTVDKRADIWAFGAVLFEMLAGQRAFPGEDLTDTLAAVVKLEPKWDAIGVDVPARVRQVLRVCLQKDPRQRAQAIGDVRLALEGAFESVAPATPIVASIVSRTWERVAWTVATLALVGLATVSFLRVRERPVEQPRVHLSVALPGNTTPAFFALSPDGRSLVMTYQNGLGIRSLDSGEIRPLTGTSGARTPFWSPDSRTIAFSAGGTLKSVPASGGPPQALCTDAGMGIGYGGTVNRAGTIVFPAANGVLARVSAAGGPCTELTKPEPAMRRLFPLFLPDGDHFLYFLETTDEARQGVYVATIGEPDGSRLLSDRSSVIFVPNGLGSNQGHLLFVREQALMAQAFDTTSLRLSGDPVKVADQVSFNSSPPQIAASADTNGTVMYVVNSRLNRQMIWYDRSGTEPSRAAMTAANGNGVSLAPDGRRVAFRRYDNAESFPWLWLQDLERNQETPLVRPPLSPGAAVWSPDGQRVVFRATSAGVDAMYVKSVNGGKEEILLKGTNPLSPSDWSRDGRWLVYTESTPKTGGDIWLLPDPSQLSADRKPVPLLRTQFDESQGQISPDGKWLAYFSDESGRSQVYLRPFAGASPTPDTKWQVSSATSREPRWRADGKELFYLDESGRGEKLMSVSIGTAPSPAGTPKLLFEFQAQGTSSDLNHFRYSPAADGQRFLINGNATEAQPSLEVILNWGKTASGK